MRTAWRALDQILRGEQTGLERPAPPDAANWLRVLALLLLLAAGYGVCMGSFALTGTGSGHAWQLLASSIKVPALFFLTLGVTLPSLYTFNALLGTRLSLEPLMHMMLAAFAVTIAVLASIGPIVAFFGVSSTSYSFIVLLNVLVFALSGGLGSRQLLHALSKSTVSTESSPGGRIFWISMAIFGVVGMQMAWLLRPFIGSPHDPFTWFRPQSGNFFESVYQHLMHLI